MSNRIEAEKGATAPTVVAGLGYPNGRREISSEPTGWQASGVTPEGAADQSDANVELIAMSQTGHKG